MDLGKSCEVSHPSKRKPAKKGPPMFSNLSRRGTMRGSLALPFLALGAPGQAWAAERMVVSEYGIVLNSLPWAVAQSSGLLAREHTGVDGFVGANGGGAAVRNMLASDLAFAEISVPAAISASQAGMDVRFVFSAVNNIGELSWVVPSNSPIRTLQDLKGKKLAFTSPRSVTEMILRIIFTKAGMMDEVTIVPAGGIGAGITAMNEGSVDAAPMVDPLLTTDAGKYRVIIPVNQYIPNLCWSIGLTTAAFAARHGEQIRSLILARRMALQLMQSDLAEAAKVYAAVWNISPQLAASLLPKFLNTNFWSPGNFSLAGLQAQVEGMRLVGQLKGSFDVTSLIDKSYLPADLQT
jgi:NitT/TauT family transport system substrate-binding protein